jgi:hypothetical protein
MRHEKVLKRADGSRVRINVEVLLDWSRKGTEWSFTVQRCEKGKRTWMSPCVDNDYAFRRLSQEAKEQWSREKYLALASAEEIESVMLELWGKMRPRVFAKVDHETSDNPARSLDLTEQKA